MRKKITLLGWYGYGNLGDEAILASMTRSISDEFTNFDLTVISHDPVFTKQSVGVSAIKQGNIISLSKLLLKTRLCILGGGGLLKDDSCIHWFKQVLLFKIFGAKTMCYAIGVSPMRKKIDKMVVKFLLNNLIDSITVRDEQSRMVLKEIGVHKEIVVSADPVLLFNPVPDSNFTEPLLNSLIKARKPVIGLCLKQFAHDDLSIIHSSLKRDEYIRRISSDLDSIIKTIGGTIVMIQSDASDLEDMFDVYDAMSYKQYVIIIEEKLTPNNFFKFTNLLDLLISQRLHPLIIASLVRIPIIAIPYAKKVRSYMDELEVSNFCIEYAQLGRGELSRKICVLLKEPDLVCSKLNSSIKKLKTNAQVNSSVLKKLLI